MSLIIKQKPGKNYNFSKITLSIIFLRNINTVINKKKKNLIEKRVSP